MIRIDAFFNRNKVGENGYGFKSTAEEVAEGVDLKGKVVLVTGATSGLGFETSKVFAAHGARLIVTGRSIEKAKVTKSEIQKQILETGRQTNQCGTITSMELDLSSLSSIEKFAEDFKAMKIPLHILVNNAGIMGLPSKTVTENGFEMQMGVNHLGHFHLTNLLTPILKKSATSKVVIVASSAHKYSRLGFLNNKQLETMYIPWEIYGNSKFSNILHAAELDRRLSQHGVRAYSLHPGVIPTGLFKHFPAPVKFIGTVFRPILDQALFKTVPQGAATQVYVALRATESEGGSFFDNCQVSKSEFDDVVSNQTIREQLWNTSRSLIENAKRLQIN